MMKNNNNNNNNNNDTSTDLIDILQVLIDQHQAVSGIDITNLDDIWQVIIKHESYDERFTDKLDPEYDNDIVGLKDGSVIEITRDTKTGKLELTHRDINK